MDFLFEIIVIGFVSYANKFTENLLIDKKNEI